MTAEQNVPPGAPSKDGPEPPRAAAIPADAIHADAPQAEAPKTSILRTLAVTLFVASGLVLAVSFFVRVVFPQWDLIETVLTLLNSEAQVELIATLGIGLGFVLLIIKVILDRINDKEGAYYSKNVHR